MRCAFACAVNFPHVCRLSGSTPIGAVPFVVTLIFPHSRACRKPRANHIWARLSETELAVASCSVRHWFHGYHSGRQFGGLRWRTKTRVARVQRRSLARPSRRSVLPRRQRRRSTPTSLSTTRSVTEHDHRGAHLVHLLQSPRIPSGFRPPISAHTPA